MDLSGQSGQRPIFWTPYISKGNLHKHMKHCRDTLQSKTKKTCKYCSGGCFGRLYPLMG